ncbi:Electron transport complex subunit RsxB [Candidatus Kinetoplastibacterium sorsogonicusi]|uniref:Electron transport complex subunit RsxB n=1 Tax=Candidatus Kinetoplastidibacterium kentomonadis TaxID=1576550 RepID=A0A3S7JA66_9PROT|nr:RnfABCDGE type electron transport complex subunit B [Candidatus Kinetoplastibacterium sorsogonicusi]AWD32570.1 Electron transport complex subunit RsxB [Candidatus Kinetoplastibacterium sorsogonicusi]
MINPLIKAIDEILPQTQCTKCGYDNCLSYANAIVNDKESINRCPPGGDHTIKKISKILNKEFIALDSSRGSPEIFNVASIDEEKCIGCTICIAECPTDAILGANKRMHIIITDYCTGCGLCVDKCPVSCINLENINRKWTKKHADLSRSRYNNKLIRMKKNFQQQSLMKNKLLKD